MDDNGNFCAIPWVHRIVNLSQPWYKFCCVSPNMPIDSISDIEKDTSLLSIKQTLLENKRPSECSFCFKTEDSGQRSYRQVIGFYKKENLNPGIRILEINLENTCNLRCVICGPAFSSRWTNHISINKYESELVNRNIDEVIKLILENKTTLEKIVISGGEPSIIPNFYRIIDTVRNTLGPKVEIYINSNGMFNDRLGEKFIDVIKEITKTNTVYCYWSCDGYDKTGEFIRDGLVYKTFINNILKIRDNTNAKHKLQITTSILNLKSQIDLIEDIFLHIKMPIKPFYMVMGKPQLLPYSLGKFITEIVTNSDLERLKSLDPIYYIEFEKMINTVSNTEPDIIRLKSLVSYITRYSREIEKPIPDDIVKIIQLID